MNWDWGEFFIFNAICDLFSSKDSDYEYDSSDVPPAYNSDQVHHSKPDIPEVRLDSGLGLFFFLFWVAIICIIILIFALLLNA